MRSSLRLPRLATLLCALLLIGVALASRTRAASPPAAPEEGGGALVLEEGAGAGPTGAGHGQTAAGHGQGHDQGHGAGPVFVTPPHSPTKVEIGMYLISLVEVSAPNESFPVFRAEMFMDIEWHDPRLAFDPAEIGVEREVFLEHEAELQLERIWWPDIEFENEQGERHTESRELVIQSDGKVAYSERFQGVFTVDMDLARFPFDQQHLTIHVESFSWSASQVVFEPLLEKTGYNEEFKTLEWLLHDVRTEVHEKQEIRAPEAFSEYVYSIEVDRDPGFYLYKIVVPLLIIVAFNWATFWMPGEEASVRMERGVIALLTVVAFHQIVATNLPRIGYLTFMDGVVFIAFASVGLTMLTTIWAQRQEHLGNSDRVGKLDQICRVAFPGVFFLALLILWIVYHR